MGTTAYEKRGIAYDPAMANRKVYTMRQMPYVCPHATINCSYLMMRKARLRRPSRLKGHRWNDHLHFRVQVDPLDCTGCANCADVCPAKAGIGHAACGQRLDAGGQLGICNDGFMKDDQPIQTLSRKPI